MGNDIETREFFLFALCFYCFNTLLQNSYIPLKTDNVLVKPQ